MKALTLWQPWAHAIAHLGKRIENRTWHPPESMIDQRLAIHAGKTIDDGVVEDLVFEGLLPADFDQRELVRGAVVAVGTLIDCIRSIDNVPDDQRIWWAGPHAWLFNDVYAIEPVPCRWNQGLWDLPADIEARVRASLRPRVINLRNEPLGDAVYIGRAVSRRGLRRSPFANPFAEGRNGSREDVLALYRQYLRESPEIIEMARRELRGKILACWCAPLPCHGDVLAAVVDGEEP